MDERGRGYASSIALNLPQEHVKRSAPEIKEREKKLHTSVNERQTLVAMRKNSAARRPS